MILFLINQIMYNHSFSTIDLHAVVSGHCKIQDALLPSKFQGAHVACPSQNNLMGTQEAK